MSCISGYHILEYPSSKDCVSSCPDGFELMNIVGGSGECINDNCMNCVDCQHNTKCVECEPNYYLISGSCHTECYGAYFENEDIW